MDDQILRIKSKWLVLQFKPSRHYLQTLMVILCVLAASICSVQAAICPPSVPSSSATTMEQCSFSGYSITYTYGIAVGSVSNSLYYLYKLASPVIAAVRKINASGSQTWMASFAFNINIKCLSVDAAEQSVYLSSYTNPLEVLKLATSDGSIVSQHKL